MVKVAHFISTSGLYGAERWILALLSHLEGVDSLLICSNQDDLSLLDEAKRRGIKTRLLKVKGNFAFFDFINRLSEMLKEEKVDILHTHGYKSDIIGYFAAKKANIKRISTPHGWSADAGLKLRLYESIDKQILRLFDLVVPHTTGFKRSLKHIKRIEWINNFVDLDDIPKPKKGNPKLITYIGQLIERKRVQDAVSALSYLPDKEIKIQIIGDGPKKEELIRLTKRLGLEDRVKFLGFREDRLELLNKSGILVLPSILEWIPRVVMEAMAMEKIVICADIPGNRELIKRGETGFLVPKKSPKKIAGALRYVLEHKKESERISKNAKYLIERKFSAEKAANEFKEVYQKIK